MRNHRICSARPCAASKPSVRTASCLAALAIAAGACLLAACGGGDDGGGSGGGPDATRSSGDSGPFRSLAIEIAVTPAEPGTEGQPQGVRLDLGLKLGKVKGVEPPLVEGVEVDFPAGSAYHGDRHPTCTIVALERRGPGACPAGSIVGRGRLLALADTARAPGRITVVNGGAKRLYFWTELNQPARVQAAVVGTIATSDGGGYRLALAIPERLQMIAGVPVALRELEVSAGRGDWLATTGCPEGHWTFQGAARFGDGSSIERDTRVDCG